MRNFEAIFRAELPKLLSELVGSEVEILTHTKYPTGLRGRSDEIDLVLSPAGLGKDAPAFLVEAKYSGASAPVALAISNLERLHTLTTGNGIPLVAAPYMGEAGKRLCEAAGISWVDLSGNADIRAPGLRILVSGKPNRFKPRGRPRDLFAPKASRIARQILLDPTQHLTQRQLAHETGLSEGYVSRLVKHYVEERLLDTDADGQLYAPRPRLLLDAWHEAYDFSKHQILKGHVAVRGGGPELAEHLHEELDKLRYAPILTGLAAAWFYDQFAMFRTATLFVKTIPAARHLRDIGFTEGARAANTWIVLPNDAQVVAGPSRLQRIRCVSRVQTLLDLKAQPERSAEASAHLLRQVGWYHAA